MDLVLMGAVHIIADCVIQPTAAAAVGEQNETCTDGFHMYGSAADADCLMPCLL